MCCQVVDTGIGLKPEQIKNLFSAFKQAEVSTSRHFGGTGLGLYLSKLIAEALGGGIDIESEFGKGSTFRVAINCGDLKLVPWLKEEPGTREQHREQQYKEIIIPILQGRILYAEDNALNLELVAEMIRKTGCTVEIAANGKSALDLFYARTFDLVIADVRLPTVDGLELCECILKSKPQLPVLALSATASQHELEEFHKVGFAEILFKPLQRQNLYLSLEKYLVKSSAVNMQFITSATQLNILLAEDNRFSFQTDR